MINCLLLFAVLLVMGALFFCTVPVLHRFDYSSSSVVCVPGHHYHDLSMLPHTVVEYSFKSREEEREEKFRKRYYAIQMSRRSYCKVIDEGSSKRTG